MPVLRCCMGLYLVEGSEGYSLVAMPGFLATVASLVAEFGLLSTWGQYLQLPGSRAQPQWLWHTAQLCRGMWHLPGSGIEPLFPALAGGFFTTEPPGK